MLGRHPTAADLLAFDQGRNCWRVATASRAAVIVDAADYFIHLRTAMLAARERILMIGWDFDTRIPLIREPIAPAPAWYRPFARRIRITGCMCWCRGRPKGQEFMSTPS